MFVWVWQSIKPGKSVALEKSSTCPSGGAASEAGPTDTMRDPSIRTTTSVAAAAPVPSSTLPAWMVSEPFERCMAAPLSARED